MNLKPAGKPEILMWTFGGMIGYHGLNECGVAHFANDLGGGPVPRFALPHYPLKRLLLECGTLEEALALFQSLPLWASGNYVLCDGTGRILDVEATPQDYYMLLPTNQGCIVHTNHFLGPRHATKANYANSAPDSFIRLARLHELLLSRWGDLSVADLQQFLRDRDGHPNAICRSITPGAKSENWMTAGITVASIVAEPLRRRLYIAAGNGYDVDYISYKIEDG